jgi:hypothetical protein
MEPGVDGLCTLEVTKKLQCRTTGTAGLRGH